MPIFTGNWAVFCNIHCGSAFMFVNFDLFIVIFQVEGAFVQGIGYFMTEEYVTNSDGLVISDGTWTYKIPTMDTIPKQLNVNLLNSGFHKKRVLSSKGT